MRVRCVPVFFLFDSLLYIPHIYMYRKPCLCVHIHIIYIRCVARAFVSVYWRAGSGGWCAFPSTMLCSVRARTRMLVPMCLCVCRAPFLHRNRPSEQQPSEPSGPNQAAKQRTVLCTTPNFMYNILWICCYMEIMCGCSTWSDGPGANRISSHARQQPNYEWSEMSQCDAYT